MAVDPSIALSFKPIQLADPLAQYGQISAIQDAQTRNQLNQLQMREAEATAQERNQLRQLDPTDPNYVNHLFRLNPQLGIQYRKEASATEASKAATASSKASTAKSEFELAQSKAKNSIRQIAQYNTIEDAMAHIQDEVTSGKITPQQAQQFQNSLPSSNAQMRDWQVQMLRRGLDAEKLLEQQFTSQDLGNRTRLIATNKYGGGNASVVAGSEINKAMSPDASARLAQEEKHFKAGGYTYDLDRGVRIDRNGIATPLMQQAPTVGGGIPTGRGSALQGAPTQPTNLIPLGPKPFKVAPNELRDEVNALTKDFRVVQDAHSKIKNVANTGAGDMSLLYSFVKLLDPGSVVRESEFAAAAQSGSYGERIQGAVNRALTGQRLPDPLRKDFIREADNLYKSQKSGNDRIVKQYTEIAKRAGLNPEDVIVPYAASEEVIPDTPPPGAVRRRGQ